MVYGRKTSYGPKTASYGIPRPPESGGIALVQSASGTTADGSTGLPVNFGVPVTAANSVICLSSLPTDSGIGPAVTVGGGGVAIAGEAGFAEASPSALIRYLHNVASGVTGVLYTPDNAVRSNNIIAEYSGLADAPAEDTATNTATSTTLAIGTITPTSANNLLTAIFAFNANVTVEGIANDVLVTGIGAGVYTYRGLYNAGNGDYPIYVLEGTAWDGINPFSAIFGDADAITYLGWIMVNASGVAINGTSDLPAFPQDASWTGSTVTEIPGWELVGTRTGGASVWQYVYEKIQTSADASNPTIVLSGSADIAGAAAAFGGV